MNDRLKGVGIDTSQVDPSRLTKKETYENLATRLDDRLKGAGIDTSQVDPSRLTKKETYENIATRLDDRLKGAGIDTSQADPSLLTKKVTYENLASRLDDRLKGAGIDTSQADPSRLTKKETYENLATRLDDRLKGAGIDTSQADPSLLTKKETYQNLATRLDDRLKKAGIDVSKADPNRLAGDAVREAKNLGGEIAREGKKAGGDLAREGKKALGDIAREGKNAAGDLAREIQKARSDIIREGKKAGGDIADTGKKALYDTGAAEVAIVEGIIGLGEAATLPFRPRRREVNPIIISNEDNPNYISEEYVPKKEYEYQPSLKTESAQNEYEQALAEYEQINNSPFASQEDRLEAYNKLQKSETAYHEAMLEDAERDFKDIENRMGKVQEEQELVYNRLKRSEEKLRILAQYYEDRPYLAPSEYEWELEWYKTNVQRYQALEGAQRDLAKRADTIGKQYEGVPEKLKNSYVESIASDTAVQAYQEAIAQGASSQEALDWSQANYKDAKQQVTQEIAKQEQLAKQQQAQENSLSLASATHPRRTAGASPGNGAFLTGGSGEYGDYGGGGAFGSPDDPPTSGSPQGSVGYDGKDDSQLPQGDVNNIDFTTPEGGDVRPSGAGGGNGGPGGNNKPGDQDPFPSSTSSDPGPVGPTKSQVMNQYADSLEKGKAITSQPLDRSALSKVQSQRSQLTKGLQAQTNVKITPRRYIGQSTTGVTSQVTDPGGGLIQTTPTTTPVQEFIGGLQNLLNSAPSNSSNAGQSGLGGSNQGRWGPFSPEGYLDEKYSNENRHLARPPSSAGKEFESPIPFNTYPDRDESGFTDYDPQKPGGKPWSPGGKKYGDFSVVGGSESTGGRDEKGNDITSPSAGIGMTVPVLDDRIGRDKLRQNLENKILSVKQGVNNAGESVRQTASELADKASKSATELSEEISDELNVKKKVDRYLEKKIDRFLNGSDKSFEKTWDEFVEREYGPLIRTYDELTEAWDNFADGMERLSKVPGEFAKGYRDAYENYQRRAERFKYDEGEYDKWKRSSPGKDFMRFQDWKNSNPKEYLDWWSKSNPQEANALKHLYGDIQEWPKYPVGGDIRAKNPELVKWIGRNPTGSIQDLIYESRSDIATILGSDKKDQATVLDERLKRVKDRIELDRRKENSWKRSGPAWEKEEGKEFERKYGARPKSPDAEKSWLDARTESFERWERRMERIQRRESDPLWKEHGRDWEKTRRADFEAVYGSRPSDSRELSDWLRNRNKDVQRATKWSDWESERGGRFERKNGPRPSDFESLKQWLKHRESDFDSWDWLQQLDSDLDSGESHNGIRQ